MISATGVLTANALAADLTIDLDGIQPGKGKIMIAVYDSAENFLHHSLRVLKVPATEATMHVKLEGLAPGNYAISLYQDINSNSKLDSNFLGIPNEPYGFSNNATGSFGPPKFDAARIDLPMAGKNISIGLRD